MTEPWIYVVAGKPYTARDEEHAKQIADRLRKKDPEYKQPLYVLTVYEPTRVGLTGINNVPPYPTALRPDDV